MSDNKSLLPDVIGPISDAIHQNLPATEHQTDIALSTVVGFFNNVVLYPVKKANLTFRYKLEAFEDDLNEKTKHIPPENLQIPPTMIAGPTLEALRYTYDETELREMYENLLASAMDNRNTSKVHPSFVDLIKQMSPLDAIVLDNISDNYQLACVKVEFTINQSTQVYSNAMPNFFVPELASLADPFDVSTSIENLSRLGVINIYDATISGYNYSAIKEHPYIVSRKQLYETLGKVFSTEIDNKTIRISDYGKVFSKICLGKEV